jgi:hypothetical protein
MAVDNQKARSAIYSGLVECKSIVNTIIVNFTILSISFDTMCSQSSLPEWMIAMRH